MGSLNRFQCALLAMLGVGSALADVPGKLLVYEPFDYAVHDHELHGQLGGRNGGMGFKGAWQDTDYRDTGGAGYVHIGTKGDKSKVDRLGTLAWDGEVENFPTMGGYISGSPYNISGDRINSSRKLLKSAGEMAKGNKGVLWVSAVWHFPHQSFFAPVSMAFTNGGGIKGRAEELTDRAEGIGTGNGKNMRKGMKRLNPMIWKDGKELASQPGTNVSNKKDNIVILRFEFGETDKVSAWYFTEDQKPSKAEFTKNAISTTGQVDEFALDTFAFGTVLRANAFDELRIGTSFESVLQGKIPARQKVGIVKQSYDKKTDTYTIEISSNPGEVYGVFVDEDKGGYSPCVNPLLVANEKTKTTIFGPFKNPSKGRSDMKFKLGYPDRIPPRIVRGWGVGNRVSLRFSEAIHPDKALETNSYRLKDKQGNSVRIKKVKLSPRRDVVYLETESVLSDNTHYTIEAIGLTDLSTLPLEDGVRSFWTWDDDPKGLPVFIVAGQSNMVGRGRFDKGQENKVGGIGSLRHYAKTNPKDYGHLMSEDGKWKPVQNVNFWHNNLKIKMADIYPRDSFGPEFGFSHSVRKFYREKPILIIKMAWGGKSLYRDFCSPTAAAKRDGKLGYYYQLMMDSLNENLGNLETHYPEYKGMGYQIKGIAWHQGYNDMFAKEANEGYEENLVDFIKDLRREFGKPKLPFAIATTGHGGMKVTIQDRPLIGGQLAVADAKKYPEFSGNVTSVDTRPFQRTPEESPRNDGSHWHCNGETYFLIGKHLGDDMVKMLGNK